MEKRNTRVDISHHSGLLPTPHTGENGVNTQWLTQKKPPKGGYGSPSGFFRLRLSKSWSSKWWPPSYSLYQSSFINPDCSWLAVEPYPSEKYESVNWDDELPNMMGKITFMFQTTNQVDIADHDLVSRWYPPANKGSGNSTIYFDECPSVPATKSINLHSGHRNFPAKFDFRRVVINQN